ncbi:MAG: hypothetical protein OXC95_12710 [Dehalococcoidia bacterium]|nr:hypothetical protein [Dehalococcoidia bacterium]
MRVLGRELADPFTEFWQQLAPELPFVEKDVEEGLSAVFGDQGADATAPYEPRWMSLPDDDLAYHVAHELTHQVLLNRKYPKTMRGMGYPPGSAEARVGEDLEEMVLHPSLEMILEPFGFTHEFILSRMAEGAMSGLASAPVPEYGTPWHFTWAIRYCLLKMELPLYLWTPIENIYLERAPDATALGRELLEIMFDVGWGSRKQALEAMTKTRDCLGLDVQDKVLVLDTTDGRIL